MLCLLTSPSWSERSVTSSHSHSKLTTCQVTVRRSQGFISMRRSLLIQVCLSDVLIRRMCARTDQHTLTHILSHSASEYCSAVWGWLQMTLTSHIIWLGKAEKIQLVCWRAFRLQRCVWDISELCFDALICTESLLILYWEMIHNHLKMCWSIVFRKCWALRFFIVCFTNVWNCLVSCWKGRLSHWQCLIKTANWLSHMNSLRSLSFHKPVLYCENWVWLKCEKGPQCTVTEYERMRWGGNSINFSTMTLVSLPCLFCAGEDRQLTNFLTLLAFSFVVLQYRTLRTE